MADYKVSKAGVQRIKAAVSQGDPGLNMLSRTGATGKTVPSPKRNSAGGPGSMAVGNHSKVASPSNAHTVKRQAETTLGNMKTQGVNQQRNGMGSNTTAASLPSSRKAIKGLKGTD